MTDPVDANPDLPWEVQRWSINLGDNQILTYGDVHGMIHRDISLGNSYRSERIKLLLTLATGMFGFTVTFHKDLLGGALAPEEFCLVIAGWAGLLLSMLAGIIHLRKWEDYYLEFSRIGAAIWRYRTAPDAAAKERATTEYNGAKAKMKGFQNDYKWANNLQTGALLGGMALLAIQIVASGFHPPAAGATKAAGTATKSACMKNVAGETDPAVGAASPKPDCTTGAAGQTGPAAGAADTAKPAEKTNPPADQTKPPTDQTKPGADTTTPP